MADEWELVEAEKNYWAPVKEGEEMVGTIVEISQGQFGKSYVIKDLKGNLVKMPSHKVLQSRLVNCQVGEQVRIIFKGTAPPKARGEKPTMLYEVWHKRSQSIPEEQVA